MPLTKDDLDKIQEVVRSTLNEGTAEGQQTWAGTSKKSLAIVQGLHNDVTELQRPGQGAQAEGRQARVLTHPEPGAATRRMARSAAPDSIGVRRVPAVSGPVGGILFTGPFRGSGSAAIHLCGPPGGWTSRAPAGPAMPPVRPCSGWGLPSRRGRPRRWCALTAPFHPCLCPLRGHRRSALCCPIRQVTPSWLSPAPCPAESRPSSTGRSPPRPLGPLTVGTDTIRAGGATQLRARLAHGSNGPSRGPIGPFVPTYLPRCLIVRVGLAPARGCQPPNRFRAVRASGAGPEPPAGAQLLPAVGVAEPEGLPRPPQRGRAGELHDEEQPEAPIELRERPVEGVVAERRATRTARVRVHAPSRTRCRNVPIGRPSQRGAGTPAVAGDQHHDGEQADAAGEGVEHEGPAGDAVEPRQQGADGHHADVERRALEHDPDQDDRQPTNQSSTRRAATGQTTSRRSHSGHSAMPSAVAWRRTASTSAAGRARWQPVHSGAVEASDADALEAGRSVS